MKIDSNLKWDDHINAIIPKLSSKIGILRSLRKIVLIETYTVGQLLQSFTLYDRDILKLLLLPF